MQIKIGPFKYDNENKPKKKKKPKMEFSKKILFVSWFSGSLVVIFACWLTYKMVIDGHVGDVSLIQTILAGGFAEITAGTGFYYWKSRRENEIKLRKIYKENYVESEDNTI